MIIRIFKREVAEPQLLCVSMEIEFLLQEVDDAQDNKFSSF